MKNKLEDAYKVIDNAEFMVNMKPYEERLTSASFVVGILIIIIFIFIFY